MVDLLSAADRAEIEQAFKDVMETYSQTPVIIRKAGLTMSAFNEDREDIDYTDYAFKAIVKYGHQEKMLEPNLGGAFDNDKVLVTIHNSQFVDLGLMIDDFPDINQQTDLIIINGDTFRIDSVSMKSQREKLQTNVYIIASRENRSYNTPNV